MVLHYWNYTSITVGFCFQNKKYIFVTYFDIDVVGGVLNHIRTCFSGYIFSFVDIVLLKSTSFPKIVKDFIVITLIVRNMYYFTIRKLELQNRGFTPRCVDFLDPEGRVYGLGRERLRHSTCKTSHSTCKTSHSTIL